MDRDEPKERRTPAREPPPEGHHDAHEKPRAPYGTEEHMHEEQVRQREREKRREG